MMSKKQKKSTVKNNDRHFDSVKSSALSQGKPTMMVFNRVSSTKNARGKYTLEPLEPMHDFSFDASEEENVKARLNMMETPLDFSLGYSFGYIVVTRRLPNSNLLVPQKLPNGEFADDVVDIRDDIEYPDGIDPENCQCYAIYPLRPKARKRHQVIWLVLRPQLPSEERIKDRVGAAAFEEFKGELCGMLFDAILDGDVDGQFNAEIVAAESEPNKIICFPEKRLTPVEWVRILQRIPCLAEILEGTEDQAETAMEILKGLSEYRYNYFYRCTPDCGEVWSGILTFDEKYDGEVYVHFRFAYHMPATECKYRRSRKIPH